MFKDLGQITQLMGLMKQLPRLREEGAKLQERIAQLTAEGDAGAGLVRVKVSGKMEVLSVSISDDALRGGDREVLEDLVRAAVNQALGRAKKSATEEMERAAANLGLTPGSLPGGLDLSALLP